MIHGFRDPDALVYHYTAAETAVSHILADGTLRFGPYEATNDPRETKSWQFNLATTGSEDLGKYPFVEISQQFSALLKRNAKVLCCSTDLPPLTGDHVRDILNRGFAKPRMWAQYGRNHTGVCLVFKKSRLLEKMREQFPSMSLMAGPVSYRNRLVTRDLTWHEFMIDMHRWELCGPSDYAREHITKHYQALFFEKLNDWRDENEWRAILWSQSPDPVYVRFGDALVGVMHGAGIDTEVSVKIAEMTDDANVEHMGLTWKNSSPWYHYEAMRWSAADRKSPWSKHAR